MTLVRTSLLNGVAVVVRMLTLLGINKVLAIYVGPSGYAVIGQFQNAVQMITTFASGAINTGVTKYTAEYVGEEHRQRAVWRTAGSVALVGSLITGCIIALANRRLAEWFLDDPAFGGVFIWFAATLVLFTFNALLLAILNGKKEISRYVLANIAGSIFALAVTAIMVIRGGLYGALVALAVYQSLTFFATLILCRRAAWFRVSYLFGKPDRAVVSNLAKYSAMALATAAALPVSHLLVRDYLGDTFGWETAGYWEAMWRLSAAYLMLVTTTLSVYFLPRLSELTAYEDIKAEIVQGYRIILPMAAFSALAMYWLRQPLITVLFSQDFQPMETLFAWQLVGDTLKIGGWVIGYLMLGKAMTRMFIISEIAFASSFVLLTVLLTGLIGFEGVALAHAVNYAAYWLIIGFFVVRKLSATQGETQ